MSGSTGRHRVLIVGGGTAGITVAARLRRAGVTDVALIEPSNTHYYQPMWTLVGGGRAPVEPTARPEQDVLPRGVRWYRDAAVEIDPDAHTVGLAGGGRVAYDFLVVAPGLQLRWDAVPGLERTLGRGGVSSNYSYDFAPATWNFIRNLRSGTAVFTMPSTPVKCGGAPMKIAFLAADYWHRTGVARDIRIVLAFGASALFRVAAYLPALEAAVERYGLDLRLSTELVEVRPERRQAVLHELAAGPTGGTGGMTELDYDFMHVTPPQQAPDWIRSGPLAGADDPGGYVTVDPATLRHTRYPDVFALGDVAGLPTSKTGAAIRKQAPVVVANLLALLDGREPRARYDGYTACPIVTARDRMVLAEFDYALQPRPSIPMIDTTRARRDMYLLKRYGLPAFYWNLMLRGLGS
ncbi:pyridine nucleotide-disulfide oxidoreductase [Frankia sp. R43]|uniref:NAD(P)/FAD-dependent oxidoreductase n=1 Tax=Frankia sp. R43 TaxID=269536 RepID=UPI0006C9FA4C|nr:FAD/NAD(P)-binding oxidoreductase [Frankia sp. R43]KPM54055.1 pyridine nucleotide-disulfide oxidoreductase [Frankia sp. R43]